MIREQHIPMINAMEKIEQLGRVPCVQSMTKALQNIKNSLDFVDVEIRCQ